MAKTATSSELKILSSAAYVYYLTWLQFKKQNLQVVNSNHILRILVVALVHLSRLCTLENSYEISLELENIYVYIEQ